MMVLIVLSVFIAQPCLWSSQKIEIISANRKFSSFEKYKKFRNKNSREISSQEKVPLVNDSAAPQEEINDTFSSFIASEKHPEEFSFDPQKVKTIVLNSDGQAAARVFAQVAPQTSFKKSVEEFAQKPAANGAKPLNVFHDDLEGVLEETTGDQKDPQLYLMDDKKLRIMTLTPVQATQKP